MRRCLPAFVLFFIFLYCLPAFAQGKVGILNLTVEGTAAINQNDIAGARDGAIQDALQRAILEAASSLMSLPVKDKKFLPVKNEIIEQQDKYINNYKIAAESKQAETYTVAVNVAIELLDLKNDLAKMGFLKVSGENKNNIIVSLDVRGFNKYSDYSYLKEFLKKRVKIVKNIYPRTFKWQEAHLELEISGTAQALADEIAKAGMYVLNTEQIKKNQIAIDLIQREEE